MIVRAPTGCSGGGDRRPVQQRRALWVWALAVATLIATAGPAAADPPRPGNFTSQVESIDPAVPGLAVEVLGGDGFLQVRADGHQVLVPGYDEDEQYLRFDPDGRVWVNLRSAAHWQNESRYLTTSAVPADVGADAPPRWVQVSDDGTWAWHDHRIHWMSPTTLPGEVDPRRSVPQVAFDWPLELVVDGEVVAVTGTLTWLPDASPVPAVLGLLLGLAVVGLLGRRFGPRTAIAGGTALGVAATGVVGLAGVVGLPPGVVGEPLPLILTMITLVVAVSGLAVGGRTAAAGVIAGAAGIPLLVWAGTSLGAVTSPVVPPEVLPAWLVRGVVGLAAGVGVGLVLTGLRDLFTQPLASAGGDAARVGVAGAESSPPS